jgi:hypothetical protein
MEIFLSRESFRLVMKVSAVHMLLYCFNSHCVLGPWYQPEVYYNIFMRALFNKDIATGLIPVSDYLSTVGPSSTVHVKNKIPARPESRCYILDPGTCTLKQFETVINGTAIIKDFIVIGNVEDEVNENESKDGKQQDMSVEGRPEL